MSVHQRLGPPVGQPAPSRSNVPRTSGNIIDGDVRIGRGGRFQEGPSIASHQSTTGGPSRSAYRSPPRHFNGPASAGPAGPMHHNGAGGYAGTNPLRRPPPLDAASSTSEERIVQICANHNLLIEFKNERCKQSPAHTQSHGASGHTAAAGGGGGIQHSASAPRGNANQNRVSAASSRSRTQHQRSAASQQEPGPAPHRGYSHQPPPPLQTADVAAPSRLPAARTLATQQPQSGQPFTKRGSDGRKNGPSRPRMHREDAQQQSPMQQEFDYLPPSWGKGNSQGQSQDSQLQVEERAPANVRGRGGAGGGRGSHRERQAPSIRQSARGGGRRQISERADKGEVQSPRPARGEKAVPPTTEADERPGGLADSSGRPANQQRRGRGYASSRRRGGRARLTAKPAKSTNGEPSTENPAAPSDSAPPSQPKTATAAAPAGDEDSVAGDIEQLRLQIDMKNGAGQPTTNHSETALEQRAEFEGDESTEGESEDESSSSSESEFTEDTEEEEEDGEEDEEDQDQEPSLTEKPDVQGEKTLKQAPEPNAEEQETTSPHGDMDSKAASESTMDDPNEDATAEATEDIQSGDEEKTTEQQHSEADTPTVPPTPKAKVVEQETTSLQGSTDSKAASESTSSGRDEETATEATENIQSGDKEVATPQQHSEPDIPTMPESKVEEQETTSSHGDTDSKPADESSLGGLNVDATAEATENRKSGYEEAETAQQHSEPDTPTTSPTPETKVKEQETTSSQGDADSKPTDESPSDAPNGDATAVATENIQSGGEEKATPQQHTEPDTSTPPPTVSSTASHDADHSPEEDMGNSEGHTEEPSNDLDETHRSSQGSNRAPTPQQTSTKPQEPQSPASNDTNCTVVNHPTGSGDNPEKSPRSPKDTHESNSKSNPVSTPQRVSTSNRKSKRGSTKDTSHPDLELSSLVANRLLRDYRPILCDREPKQPPPLDCQMPVVCSPLPRWISSICKIKFSCFWLTLHGSSGLL
ncbi:hypothetical protein SprV_0301051900 [Sparganum proliferum]